MDKVNDIEYNINLRGKQNIINEGKQKHMISTHGLTDLGYKILIDRYAHKGLREDTQVGDLVVVIINSDKSDLQQRREIGTVQQIDNGQVKVKIYPTDEEVIVPLEHIDKPLETTPEEIQKRVARGVAAVEEKDNQKHWQKRFEELLNNWKFVPGGRILAAAGTNQDLSLYNCFVIPSPEDSREGIIETLGTMAEIMARGGGVGINVSTLRPRHAYVKGVNGRSSGSVSWAALYSFVTGLIEQGGCFAPNTRIATDKGLIPIVEIVERMEKGEKFYAQTHEGMRAITDKFRNGVKPLLRIKTKRGYSVDVTPNHPMLYLQDGKIADMRADTMAVGDKVLLSNVVAEHSYIVGDDVKFKKVTLPEESNATIYKTPETMTPDLAYLLGYSYGDGAVVYQSGHVQRLELATHSQYTNMETKLTDAIEHTFGYTPALKTSTGDLSNRVIINSRYMLAWLQTNRLLKEKAEDIRVPEAIYRSDRESILAFIAGYFDADGNAQKSKKTIKFSSISHDFLQDIQMLLGYCGIVSQIHKFERPQKNWQTIYELYIRGNTHKARFNEYVPSCKDTSIVIGKRDMTNMYPSEVISAYLPKYRQGIYDGVSKRISTNRLTKIAIKAVEKYSDTQAKLEIDELLNLTEDTIVSIESIGKSETFDITVEHNHYINSNVIYTGNSRRGALMLILNDWHPDVFDFINSKRESGKITNANISVGISDRFMEAVKNNEDWQLRFPDTSHEKYNSEWNGDLEEWEAKGYPVDVHHTVNAKDLWDTIIESAWASAEPGVWFRERSNKMSNSFYYPQGKLKTTNPCAEQPLADYAVCNLGAINLGKFYDEKTGWYDDEALYEAAYVGARFLDNVIDASPYHLPENEEQQKNERRVGLGIMGLAELLIKINVVYGSQQGADVTKEIFETIARGAYQSSIDTAKEKGTFPYYSPELLNSGYAKKLPTNIREQIEHHGLRNVTLLTVAPTGCVTSDTIVSTGKGLNTIANFGDVNGEKWQDINKTVITDNGEKQATKFYINGFVDTRKIRTKRGYEVEASLQHRLRVIDESGHYVWKYVNDLSEKDTMVLMRDTATINDEKIQLQIVSTDHFNSNVEKLPRYMNEQLAELLGYYMGDGYTKDNSGLVLVINNNDRDLTKHFTNIAKSLFGDKVNCNIEERVGCHTLTISGRSIVRYFEENNFKKSTGNNGEGAESAFVPIKILQAGRNCIAAFLRGLFEADGGITRQVVTHATVSETLSKQVQTMLLSLNVVSDRRYYHKSENSFGKRNLWQTRLINRREIVRYREEIGFISERKTNSIKEVTPFDRGDNIQNKAIINNFYKATQGIKSVERQKIAGKVNNGGLSIEYVKDCIDQYKQVENTELAQLVTNGMFFDEIVEVIESEANTYDITVPDNNTYIANGFVSHNTTGTAMNTSTGIEPFFSWKWYRKGRLGLHEEEAPIVKWWLDKHNIKEEEWDGKLPDVFVSAMDLAPEEHVLMQSAAQRWVDSAISKTCNVPNNYTVEQTRDLYELMYELGCKGGTIYRDGSRDEQVLSLTNDNDNDNENTENDITHTLEEIDVSGISRQMREQVLSGTTIKGNSPYGSIFVTVNEDPTGVPYEVFVTIGKSGSDLQAMGESIGRLISISLQTQHENNRKEMLEILCEQLRHIGGARQGGFGPNRTNSIPDAIAKTIIDKYIKPKNANELADEHVNTILNVDNLPNTNGIVGIDSSDDHLRKVQVSYKGASVCPSCGNMSLMMVDGCKKCDVCGYSEC